MNATIGNWSHLSVGDSQSSVCARSVYTYRQKSLQVWLLNEWHKNDVGDEVGEIVEKLEPEASGTMS